MTRYLDFVRVEATSLVSPRNQQDFMLKCGNGDRIGANVALGKWTSGQVTGITDLAQKILVASMATAVLRDEKVCFEFYPPEAPEEPSDEFLIKTFHGYPLFAIPFSSRLREHLSVHTPCKCVNRNHPVVQEVLKGRYIEQVSALQLFSSSLVWCLSNPEIIDYAIDPTKQVSRWPKAVGSQYLDVEWDQVDKTLYPPYRIRTDKGDDIEITHDILQRWGEAESGTKGWKY